MLKNYIYYSTAKIDLLWPQLPASYLRGAKAKTTLNLGVLKTEVEAADADLTTEEKLQRIIEYLDKEDEIGTIQTPKRYFRGEISARSLVDGRLVFFGATIDMAGRKKYVGLTGSMKHMIGYEYRGAEKEDFNSYYTKQVGDSELYRGGSSASIGFSRVLRHLWEKDEAFESAKLDYEKEQKRRLAEHQLSQKEIDIINNKRWLNFIVNELESVSVCSILFGWMARPVRPVMRLLLGAQVYEKKKSALMRQEYYKTSPAPEKVLEEEDRDLLHSVKSITKQIDAPKRDYEFIAITLLDGQSFDDPVILGSPLYIADNYSPNR